jgi:type II secretory ATPase GspE/PulE/Tfp pilus assembly ATPase PilB-like protein
MSTTAENLRSELAKRSPQSMTYATEAVDLLLEAASALRASDIHLQPTAEAFDVQWRLDGVLHAAAHLPSSVAPKIVARLKVLADLLTYKTDVPQEGRIRAGASDVEMRLSTFPTLYGEKAVVRLFAGTGRFERLDDLGLPDEILSGLRRLLGATSGAILFSGPAGSGKTTTIYACLRELVETSDGRRSLATLEDPIEVAVRGVAQSQVNPAAGFSLEVGLRSLLRQDPEVIAVGEIRDRGTAEAAFQASLTGHLVLSTFHAASAAAVVGRLGDMGIEPYLLRSGLLAVIGQRLLRRLCECSRASDDPMDRLGLAAETWRVASGCDRCAGTGYRGRIVIAEMLVPEPTELGRAILSRIDTPQLEALAIEAGMLTLWERANAAVEAGLTSPSEVRRVLGLSDRAANRGISSPST